MIVSELIDAVSRFAFGRKNPTESDRQDYLFLLNLADLEFYSCIKNSKYLRYKTDVFFENGEYIVDLPDIHINYILNNDKKLKELDEKDGLEFVSTNGGYYILDKKLNVNPYLTLQETNFEDVENKRYLTLVAQRKRKNLVERVVNEDYETDTPIYAEEYHIGLIHGATYFLCLSHEGFATKIAETKNNFKTAIGLLMSHYVKGT